MYPMYNVHILGRYAEMGLFSLLCDGCLALCEEFIFNCTLQALAARALAYNDRTVQYKNPRAVSVTCESGSNNLQILFDTDIELRAPVRGPCPVAATSCAWINIEGINATITSVSGHTAVVSAPGVACTTGGTWISYLYGDWPVPTVYAAGSGHPGLPALPFLLRT
eukprot:m.20643 g.20643  ORF g.20643 m.20643 type:complete len:166 (-) comp12210_c0_seq1:201-698(-)